MWAIGRQSHLSRPAGHQHSRVSQEESHGLAKWRCVGPGSRGAEQQYYRRHTFSRSSHPRAMDRPPERDRGYLGRSRGHRDRQRARGCGLWQEEPERAFAVHDCQVTE